MKSTTAGGLVLVMFSMLGGCQKGDNTTDPANGSGTIAVRLVDAPAGYDAVNIAVDSIRVHLNVSDTVGGWYTISRFPAVYNLLDFTNGNDTIIAEGLVPAGYYSQIRLYVNDGCNIIEDGSIHSLEVPSGTQSGLKLNVQANILPGVRYVVTLDFDAGRSIVVTGNGRYMLKPVIKVVSTAVSGSMTGIIAPDTTFGTLWAIAGTDTATIVASPAGNFKFSYLAPAVYTLKIFPSNPVFRDSTLTNVSVFATQNTDVGTIVLQQK